MFLSDFTVHGSMVVIVISITTKEKHGLYKCNLGVKRTTAEKEKFICLNPYEIRKQKNANIKLKNTNLSVFFFCFFLKRLKNFGLL